jgi:hypothetical protein
MWASRPTARDRMRRRRRLGDLLACPAGVLLPHVLDHLPLAGHQLQRLGHVLAQLVQGSTTARAGLRARVDDALAWQMVGQGPTCRLTPFERLHLNPARSIDLVPGLGLGLILFQIEQAELELAQQRAALR